MAAILWAIIIVLFVLWLIGFVIAHVAGSLVHLLLLVALVLLVFNLLSSSRKPV